MKSLPTISVRRFDGYVRGVCLLGLGLCLGVAPQLFADDGEQQFIRGDANVDGTIDLADGAAIIFFFGGNYDPPCFDALDVNDDGAIDVGDLLTLYMFLFDLGTRPAPPFPNCGIDPSMDEIGCGFYPCP